MSSCRHPITIRNPKKNLGPFDEKFIQVPCGKCLPCLRRRQNDWAFRIQMEARDFPDSTYFITLTLSDENVCTITDHSTGEQFPTLSISQLQLFFKRLRKWLNSYFCTIDGLTKVRYNGSLMNLEQLRFIDGKGRISLDPKFKTFRYFACGEYGDRLNRPHYHAVCFFPCPVPDLESILKKTWGLGYIMIDPLNPSRSKYVAKYTCKKLVCSFDNIQNPFAIMSRFPAIGHSFIKKFGDFILSNEHFFVRDEAGTPYNLPRYYRDRIYQDKPFLLKRHQRECEESRNTQDFLYFLHNSGLGVSAWKILSDSRESAEKNELLKYLKNEVKYLL